MTDGRLVFLRPPDGTGHLIFGDAGDPPTDPDAVQVRVFDGAAWVAATVKRWNGTAWITTTVKRRNSTQWQ
jgi:hypothetical protein